MRVPTLLRFSPLARLLAPEQRSLPLKKYVRLNSPLALGTASLWQCIGLTGPAYSAFCDDMIVVSQLNLCG